MRTTLTLDDDLAKELHERARRNRTSFKDTVNQVLRAGLSRGASPSARPDPFVVDARACGFRPGIDPAKLNQLTDELEAERFVEKLRGSAEPR